MLIEDKNKHVNLKIKNKGFNELTPLTYLTELQGHEQFISA